MMNIRINALVSAFLTLPAFAQSPGDGSALSGDGNSWGSSVYMELEYDDNVFKRASDKESDLKEVVGANVSYNHEGRALVVGLDYDVNHERYEDDSFSGETRLSGNSSVRISTYPERYAWYVQHQQTVTDFSSQAVRTSDNLEQRSILSTGPDITLKLTPVDSFTASARFTDVSYDERDENDSERLVARMSWNHQLSPAATLGLNASHTEVENETGSGEYNQQRYGVRFSRSFKQGSFFLEGGETKLDRETRAVDDIDGTYVQVELNSSWGGNSFGASYARDVTDSSIGLSQSFNFGSGFDSGDINFDNVDIVTRSRYQLFFNRVNASGKLHTFASVALDDQDYETLLEDEESQRLRFGLSYALTQSLNASLQFRFSVTEYLEQPLFGEDEERNVSLRFTQKLDDKWSFSYGASYDERENSDRPEVDHESVAVYLRVVYRIR